MGEGLEDRMGGHKSDSESKIDLLFILKNDLNWFEVDQILKKLDELVSFFEMKIIF